MSRKPLFALLAGAALFGAAAVASAQSTDALVDKYTTLAGSKENAQQLVSGLSNGGNFTVGGTAIDNSNGKLGNGEINIALSLTQADMDKSNLTLQAALDEVLKERASGKGWGEIANAMGLRLGDLVRSDKARGRDETARGEHAEGRVARLDRPERPEKPERPERPERPGR